MTFNGAKKHLGQHFLSARGPLHKIVATAHMTDTDTVVEVGPGKGVLTEQLVQQAGRVIAIEKDTELIAVLEEKFKNEIKAGKLELICGDVREINLHDYGLTHGSYIVVANIPYYITGEILRFFLTSPIQPTRMVLLVQKEVALRIVARDHKESILSISVKAYGTPRYIEKVSKRAFTPAPQVDSAILAIDHISRERFVSTKEERDFFATVKLGFAHKRKTALGNLGVRHEKKRLSDAFAKCDIDLRARPENISADQWQCVARSLYCS